MPFFFGFFFFGGGGGCFPLPWIHARLVRSASRGSITPPLPTKPDCAGMGWQILHQPSAAKACLQLLSSAQVTLHGVVDVRDAELRLHCAAL